MRRRDFLLAPLLLPALSRGEAGRPYAPVRRENRLAFPRDHGAHPEFRTEWWYVTGVLDEPEPEIGFQLTFFRSRTGRAEALASPLAASQILFAHAAVTRGRLHHAERIARPSLGAAYSAEDCDLHVGPWQMRRTGTGPGERLLVRATDPAFGFELALTPTQALMLQGESGWSRKAADDRFASHYVSWPQLQVSGTIALGSSVRQTRGRAWFDHEWSSELLGNHGDGWDWLGINLDDGGALMAFRIRDGSGSTAYAHASLRDAKGTVTQFGSDDVTFAPFDEWHSPRSGARYPVRLQVKIGPHTLRTVPTLDDQEISTRRPAPVSYWEGLVRVEGTLKGRGYQELTGYAGRMAL